MCKSTAESHLTRALQKLTGLSDPRRKIGDLNTDDGINRLMIELSKNELSKNDTPGASNEPR